MMDCLMQELEEYPDIHTTIVHPYQIDNNMFAGMEVRYGRTSFLTQVFKQ
jgi:hypothetical protein